MKKPLSLGAGLTGRSDWTHRESKSPRRHTTNAWDKNAIIKIANNAGLNVVTRKELAYSGRLYLLIQIISTQGASTKDLERLTHKFILI